VDEEQWDGTLDGTPLVHVMHAQLAEPVHRDGASEHGERIQLALVRAPVVPVLPPANEPPDICERHAVGPLGCLTSSGRRVSSSLRLSRARASSETVILKGCSWIMAFADLHVMGPAKQVERSDRQLQHAQALYEGYQALMSPQDRDLAQDLLT
jgi:hypothetical protein